MSGWLSYAETRISSLQRRTAKNEEIDDRHAGPVAADWSRHRVLRRTNRRHHEDQDEKGQEGKESKEGRFFKDGFDSEVAPRFLCTFPGSPRSSITVSYAAVRFFHSGSFFLPN